MTEGTQQPKLYYCPYCRKPGTRREMSREHFVPQCLWAGERPSGTKTVLAHKECNDRLHLEDEHFRDVLLAMKGVNLHPEAQAIIRGKLTRHFTDRPHLMSQYQDVELSDVYTPTGLWVGREPFATVDAERFCRVLKMMALALFFVKSKRPLPLNYKVLTCMRDPYTMISLAPILNDMSPFESFGDDVFICRNRRDFHDGNTVCFHLIFYRAVSFIAITLPSE
jgi:hypothetical protein